jgi:hypothetical protein
MNRTIRWIILFLLSFHFLNVQTSIPKKGIDSISENEIENHLFYLSSDHMKGRDTPSPELDTSAVYIAEAFEKWGLDVINEESSYFQTFHVLKNHLSEPNTFRITSIDCDTSFKIKQDFVPIYFTSNSQISAPIVFAGYGITAPEYGYDDYEDIDVKDKVVFIFTHEPQEKDSTSVFDGKEETEYSKLFEKAMNAKAHGAVGMIVVTDPNNHRFRKPPNFWPSLMRNAPQDAIPFTLEEKEDKIMVAVRIGKNLADYIIEGTEKSLSELQTLIDSTMIPQSFEIPDKRVVMETRLQGDRFPVKNVVGFWEGSDPLMKKEAVVIGAHYDHIGIQNDTLIYNGADDNASGTVGLMMLAKAFANSGFRPKRSLLFCAWAGEELGLFGSRYYVNSDPLFPLANTAAYLNMDMIGRNDTSFVRVIGFKTSADLKTILEASNKKVGLHIIERKDSELRRSDQTPFYDKHIPVLGFQTGYHDDYHKVTDTAEKCNVAGMVEICKLLFLTAWRIADRADRPEFRIITYN